MEEEIVKNKGKIFSIITSVILATSLVGCGAQGKAVPDDTFIGMKSNDKNKEAKDIYIRYEGQDFKKIVEGAQMSSNMGNMQYFPESKALLYQDASKNVFMFEKGKEKVEVAKEPSETIVNNKKHVIYLDKDKNLHFKEYGKSDVKLASAVKMARISQESNNILYTNDKGELFLCKGNSKPTKIGTGIQMFSFTESENSILVTKDDENIYSKELKENGKEQKIGGANECVFITMDKEDNIKFFKNVTQGEGKYLGDFYYMPKGKEATKIATKINCSPYEFQVVEGTLYYISEDNKLFSCELAKNQPKEIGKDIVNFSVDDKKNVAYLNTKDKLTVVKDGKTSKEIDAKDKIYTIYNGSVYLLGQDQKLMVDDTLISEHVEEIQISEGNLAYYTTDNKLFLLKAGEKKSTKILDDISQYDVMYYAGNPLYEKKQVPNLVQPNPNTEKQTEDATKKDDTTKKEDATKKEDTTKK